MIRSLNMSSLELPDHGLLLMEELRNSYSTTQFLDTRLILNDGDLWTHSFVLSAMSPFITNLLSQSELSENSDGTADHHTLLFPEVTKLEMEFILSLLYSGTVNIYRNELASIVSLTSLMKMVSIPVSLTEEPWTSRRQILSNNTKSSSLKAIINFFPSSSSKKRRGRPPKPQSSQKEERSNVVTSLVPCFVQNSDLTSSIQFTTLSASAEQQHFQDNQERSDEETTAEYSLEPFNETDDLVEEIKVYVSVDGEVERMEVIGDSREDDDPDYGESGKITFPPQDAEIEETRTEDLEESLTEIEEQVLPSVDKQPTRDVEKKLISEIGARGCVLRQEGGRVTLIHTEEGEGLDGLISVAEAFEKSQQPDFNDIASPVIDGTETEKRLVKTCLLCRKMLLGRNALGRHMKNAHPPVFGPYDCPWMGCDKLIESGSKLITHLAAHSSQKEPVEEEPRTCNTCNISFDTQEKLALHTNKVHNGEKSSSYKPVFVCTADDPSCKDIFNAARHFIKHMLSVHNLKPWRCEICNRRFSDKQNYQNHAMSHGEKKDFICDICTKVFSNPRQLYSHRSLHLGRRFLCQKCGYKARSSANLRGHVKTTHESRTFECVICQKKFSNGSNLKDHMRIHTGETPFRCDICDVNFKRRHHLNGHIESKAHIDIINKRRNEGFKVPDSLDPALRQRSRNQILDGPVALINQPNYETHISEMSVSETSSFPSKAEEIIKLRTLGSELSQVVVFESCGGVEPYRIQEQAEEIVSSTLQTVRAVIS